jgi:Leucine-rich repeat (LRR) protein
LDLSVAKVTSTGLKALHNFPQLERLSLWNCRGLDDDTATVLAGLPNLINLDLSDTPLSDAALEKLKALSRLQHLYLTGTKITAAAAETFRKEKSGCFVSWAQL